MTYLGLVPGLVPGLKINERISRYRGSDTRWRASGHQHVRLRSSYLDGITGNHKPLLLRASDAADAAEVRGVGVAGEREARCLIRPPISRRNSDSLGEC